MSYLPQGYENTQHLLAFNVVDEYGFLVDPSEVGFAIFDPDGSQVFPGAGYEEVTTGDGRLGTGRFYAYDEGNTSGWTPDGAATIGEWSIKWRWKVESGDAYSTWREYFDIVDAYSSGAGTGFKGTPYKTLITPQQARDQGLTTSDISDPNLEQLMLDVQAYIERETRQYFRPIYDTMTLDGNEAGKLFIGLPIIGVEDIFANDRGRSVSATADLQDAFAVGFNRSDLGHLYTPKPDYRRNPTIGFRGETDIFSGTGRFERNMFRSGRLNQMVKGVFGFVESDGTVPRMIQDAALRLVFANYDGLTKGGSSIPKGPLKSRTVDRHSETWATTGGGSSTLKSALATSREVEEILGRYKAPLKLASPSRSVDNHFRF